MARVALITVHGMGKTQEHYAQGLREELARRLGDRFNQIAFLPIYYQGLMQPNENAVWANMRSRFRLNYSGLREFLLFGFGDAAGIEHGKEQPESTYTQVQIVIARAMLEARAQVGPQGAVVCISHSLGCQVMSSYLYDAQQRHGPGVPPGIWGDPNRYAPRIAGRPLDDAEQSFLAGGTLRRWITTGCNIPVFVASHDPARLVPIRPPTPDFKWLNLFDPDDLLGWPLGALCPAYAQLVQDRAINAGGGMLDWLIKSWNPMSHNAYWEDSEVLVPLAEMLVQLM